jgi:hypothetical protein
MEEVSSSGTPAEGDSNSRKSMKGGNTKLKYNSL